MIDHKHIDRPFGRLQLQAELFLQRSRYSRRFARIVGRGRPDRETLKLADHTTLIANVIAAVAFLSVLSAGGSER